MGSSKKVTVGYRYYLGMHLILCHGPVDKLTRIVVDKKTAWAGESTGGAINVSATDLFGGESREGGVSGTVDFEVGAPDQAKNSYLLSKLGSNISAFRGVAAAVLRQCYLGINPYLKNWAFRVQRIHKSIDGETQWYDEKAAISSSTLYFHGDGWDYQINTFAEPNTEWSNWAIPTSGWSTGGELPFSTPEQFGGSNWVPKRSNLWIRRKVTARVDGILLRLRADNGCVVFVDGVQVGGSNTSNADIGDNQVNPVDLTFSAGQTFELAVKAFAEVLASSDGGNILRMEVLGTAGDDMNPAHIIRECLVDPNWGMGYQESDVDDASFIAAADQLFSEGFGISILWDRQTAIEDFVKEIVRHINAALYVDRTSGKFVLKLVRNDYDPDTLLVLGEGQVEKVENFSRPAFGDMINSVTVNYWDSATGTTASISAQDTALIQMQGAVVGTTIQYPGCTNPNLAARLASRDLTTLSTPLLSCTIYADRTAASLNIGDVFKLDWPDLLAEPTVMRVMSMAFGDGRSNQVKITATEDVFALPEVAVIVPQEPEWNDPSAVPTPASQRVVVEAPYVAIFKEAGKDIADTQLENAPLSGFVAASAVSPVGGAINMTVMEDAGAGYESQGVADFCPHAVLTSAVSKTDTVLHVADVGELGLVDVGDFMQLGNELVSLVSLDPALNTVTVGRGVMDSVPQEHSSGEVIYAWDSYGYVGSVEYTAGEDISVKLLPTTGRGPLDIALAPVDVISMNGRAARPYPPGNVKIAGAYWPATVSGVFSVTWAHRNRVDQQNVLVPFTSGDVTPAPNTRYGLRFLDSSDVLLVERTDIGPGTASVVLNYTGDVTMELYTIDEVGLSWQRHQHVFAYTPPGGTVVSAITATAYTPVDDSTIIDGGEI